MERTKEYDYIILLCADKKDGNGNFPDFRNGSFIGGNNRMNSILKYSLLHPEPIYIIVGGFDEYAEKSQKVEDMQAYLRIGNPSIKLISIPSLPCVHHNLVAVFNKMGEKIVNKRVAFYTNYLYIPRTMMMWLNLTEKDFPEIPVPDVLCSEAYFDLPKDVKNSEGYKRRHDLEIKGLQDLQANIYQDYCLETNPKPFLKIARNYDYLTMEKEKREV